MPGKVGPYSVNQYLEDENLISVPWRWLDENSAFNLYIDPGFNGDTFPLKNNLLQSFEFLLTTQKVSSSDLQQPTKMPLHHLTREKDMAKNMKQIYGTSHAVSVQTPLTLKITSKMSLILPRGKPHIFLRNHVKIFLQYFSFCGCFKQWTVYFLRDIP